MDEYVAIDVHHLLPTRGARCSCLGLRELIVNTGRRMAETWYSGSEDLFRNRGTLAQPMHNTDNTFEASDPRAVRG